MLIARASAAIVAVFLLGAEAASAQERPVSRWTQIDDEADKRTVALRQETTGRITNITVAGEALDLAMDDANKLGALPPFKQVDNANWIYEHRNELPGTYLLEVARVKFRNNPAEAAELYFLAQMRMRYDAMRCTDKTAAQGLYFANSIAGADLLTYLKDNETERRNAMRAVLGRSDVFDGKASPWWICSHGIMTMNRAMSGEGAVAKNLWLKAEDEWPSLQETLRDGMTKALNTPTGQ